MSGTAKPIAQLSWALDVDCPKCGEMNELVEQDEEHFLAGCIFESRWDDATGYEITCPFCEHEYELGGIEY